MRATTSSFADEMRAPILNLLLIANVAGASLAQAQTATPAPQTAAVSPECGALNSE